MKTMKLSSRIALGFASLILIMLLLNAISIALLSPVRSSARTIAYECLPMVEAMSHFNVALGRAAYEVRGYAFSEEEAYLKAAREHLAAAHTSFNAIKQVAATGQSFTALRAAIPPTEQLINELDANFNSLEAIGQSIVASRQGMVDKTNEYAQRAAEFQKMQEALATEELVTHGFDVNSSEERRSFRLHRVLLTADLVGRGYSIQLAAWAAYSNHDPLILDQIMPQIDETLAMLAQDLAEAVGDEVINTLKAMQSLVTGIKSDAQTYRNALAAWQESLTVRADLVARINEASELVLTETVKTTNAISGANNTAVSRIVQVQIIGMAVGLILGLFLGWIINRGIKNQLNTIIDTLSESAAEVDEAASMLASASNKLSDGATQNAASLEETSAALEELSSMTERNADHSAEANNLMTETQEAVQNAMTSVTDLEKAMSDIATSGDKIGRIIKTIDEIAFQTNLLALNAAVEAARAGEAGAGFAVVAEEVRNLASRSAEAARSTATLIKYTVSNIQNGTSLLETATKNVSAVSDRSARVGSLITEVAAASKEQAQGIGQINSAMLEMDTVTQANAGTAEESASSAAQMSDQSAMLLSALDSLVAMTRGTSANGRGALGAGKKPKAKMAQIGVSPQEAHSPAPKRAANQAALPLDDDFGGF